MTYIKSGMAYRLRVSMTDQDPIEVQTMAADAVAWEKFHKQSWQDAIGGATILWVAWRAMKRLGLTNESAFDRWVENVEDFEIYSDGDDDTDPTQTDL